MSSHAPIPVPEPMGVSIIAGEPAPPGPPGTAFRAVSPASGKPLAATFHAATFRDVTDAANAAWRGFHVSRDRTPAERAALLELIAARLEQSEDELVAVATEETALPHERLRADLAAAIQTVRFVASLARDPSWRRVAIDPQDSRAAQRPGVRSLLVPLGPVAVLGTAASPFARGPAGADTASALAAGCPVVAKGHPAQPATGELLAVTLAGAVRDAGFPPETFSYLCSGGTRDHDIAAELVNHPCIRAAGFTGTTAAGTALAKIAGGRPDPIPFFGATGAATPVFILPGSIAAEPAGIAQHLARAIAAGTGQQCTKPGLIFALKGGATEQFAERLARELAGSSPAPMLAPRIRDRYREALVRAAQSSGVRSAEPASPPVGLGPINAGQPALEKPVLLRTTAEAFCDTEHLHEEIFGPAALLVVCADIQHMLQCAGIIQGATAAGLFLASTDVDLAAALTNILAMRVGRLVFNAAPSPPEPGHATVHTGPHPASTRPDATAIGARALERWCRAVAYQNAPADLLPPELRDENPLGIERLVDGERTREPMRAARPRAHPDAA